MSKSEREIKLEMRLSELLGWAQERGHQTIAQAFAELDAGRVRIAELEAQLANVEYAAVVMSDMLTERTEQVERMREDIACLVDVWADQLRPERHYTETAFAELMDEAAAKLAALAAEKEQM